MAPLIKSWVGGVAVLACLVAMALCVVPLPTVQAGSVTCENHGSGDPTLADAQDKANVLISKGQAGQRCCQTNNGGDFCTVMLESTSGSGYEVRICGPYNACIGCADAGGLLWEIINQCQRNDQGTIRVSGNDFSNPVDIVLRNHNN